jgi:uncharacterized protein with GYD domain
VPEGNEDHRGVAVAVAIGLGDVDEPLDLLLGEVFTGPQFGVGPSIRVLAGSERLASFADQPHPTIDKFNPLPLQHIEYITRVASGWEATKGGSHAHLPPTGLSGTIPYHQEPRLASPWRSPYGIILMRTGTSGRTAMAAYMLLCNFTDQGVRTIKDVPKRRKAARELAKKCGVEIKTGYLAIGPYDLVIHVEAPNDEALATYLLSLASKGNVRTTTLKLFPEAEYDKIVGKVA